MALENNDRPNRGYDDGKPAWRTNMSNDEQSTDENDDVASDSNASSPDELSEAESNGAGTATTKGESQESSALNSKQGQIGSGYKQEKVTGSTKVANRFKGLSKKKKYALLAGGAGGGIFIVLIIVILALLAPLKVVHVAENMTVYNLERASRTFSDSASSVTEDTIAAQEMDQAGYKSLTDRFGSLKSQTWDLLFNKNNPEKIIKNLKAEGRLKYVYEDGGPRLFLPGNKQVLTGVELDGKFVSINDKNLFDVGGNRFERVRFAADLQATIDDSLGGVKASVRGKVVKQLLDERGISLKFWTKNGAEYQGLKETAAERLATAQTFNDVNSPDTANCTVSDLCTAATDANNQVKNSIDQQAADTESNITAAQAGDNAAKAGTDTVTSNVTGNTLGKLVGAGSIVYSVAVPACLIFDGSVQNAKSTIDNRDKSLQRTFFTVRSAADQQKAGDTTLTAVQGFNNKLGNVDDSNVLRRARGETVNTTQETSTLSQPQAGTTGTYSAFNLLFGDGTNMTTINKFVQHGCGFVTDLRTGLALVAIETTLGILSGGSTEAADGAAKTGIDAFMTNLGTKIAESAINQTLEKEGAAAAAKYVVGSLGSYVTKIGLETGAIIGSSELLKLAVIQHMNSTQNGLATGATFVNQADMGANLYGNTVNQHMLYGKPMTLPEVAMSRIADSEAIAAKNAKQSTYQRYFALSNSSSFLTMFGTSFSGTLHSILQQPGSVLASVFNSFSINGFGKFVGDLLPFHKFAFAASQASGAGDYNIVQWGWSQDELNIIHNDPNNFSPLLNAEILEHSGQKSAIETKYGTCFTSTMGDLLSSQNISRNADGTIQDNAGLCSPHNLGITNNEFGGKMVFRYRLSKLNENVLNYLNDIQNPTPSTTPTSTRGTGA
jgi:hypothetical protein